MDEKPGLSGFTIPGAMSCQHLLLASPAPPTLNACDSSRDKRKRAAGEDRDPASDEISVGKWEDTDREEERTEWGGINLSGVDDA